MDDLIWVVMLTSDGNKIVQGFEKLKPALRLAASTAGNNSYAGPLGGVYLFGRGDGNTEVLVRQLPRALCLKEDVFITPA